MIWGARIWGTKSKDFWIKDKQKDPTKLAGSFCFIFLFQKKQLVKYVSNTKLSLET